MNPIYYFAFEVEDAIDPSKRTEVPSTSGGTIKSVTAVGDGNNTLTTDITSIISAVIGALGIVCVIVMIIGGVNYMTSSGDAGKVKKAKDTILYGVIGLVVCALAFAIVNWVIAGILKQQ